LSAFCLLLRSFSESEVLMSTNGRRIVHIGPVS
jgi:hypothetical protein